MVRGVRVTCPPSVLKVQEVAEFPQCVGVKVDRERAMITGIGSKVRVHVGELWRPVEGDPHENGISWQAAVVVIAAGRQSHSFQTEE